MLAWNAAVVRCNSEKKRSKPARQSASSLIWNAPTVLRTTFASRRQLFPSVPCTNASIARIVFDTLERCFEWATLSLSLGLTLM